MDPVLRKWLTTPISWEPFLSESSRGSPSYGTKVDLMCHMEGSRQMVRNRMGEEVLTNWTLYLDDSRLDTMTEKDRITLPSGEQPPIIRVAPIYNQKGEVDHYEVDL